MNLRFQHLNNINRFRNKFGMTVIIMLTISTAFAQRENKYIRQGNKLYKEERYADAKDQYLKALEENNKSFKGSFNLGDALYKQEKYEEAATQFQTLAEASAGKPEKAKAYHNLGNSLLMQQKLEESIAAYKKALKNNPQDDETRYNLAYAMEKLKQQQQQNQDKQQEEKKEEEKKEEKQEEQKQDQQQPKKDQLSKEEAQRLLDAMQNEEKNVQEKLNKKRVGVKADIEKDW